MVVDRLVIRDTGAARLADSLETALRLAEGVVVVEVPDGGQAWVFSERLACVRCGISFPEVSPRMFSFNNPYGACPACGGLGTRLELDPDLVVPDPRKSLAKGALAPWAGRESVYFRQTLAVLARKRRFSLDTPWKDLVEGDARADPPGHRRGRGLRRRARRPRAAVQGDDLRGHPARDRALHGRAPVPGLRGRPPPAREPRRPRRRARRSTRCARSRSRRRGAFFDELALGEREQAIARRVLKEIRERLGFLQNVGLEYLTLDRAAGTLSGGEGQRIRLATQIGSSLVGVLYILDEPSIGLHQRDNRRLLDTLLRLRDLGNTVLVVEHDEETIRAADHVIDLGPGPGELGGYVVATGTPGEIMADPKSLTGRYLVRRAARSRSPPRAGPAPARS